jgi:diguanylate cyclase (GGDEF)-like protein/PAS domain S-box-containing protein
VKPRKSQAPLHADEEISTLINTLVEAGQRLEVLTGGEVDTVADPEGRLLLLRGTQAQLRRSEDAKQAVVLNALPMHIALLDGNGIIVSVNDAWRLFHITHGIQNSECKVGSNYFEICSNALGQGSSDAHLVAEGIRSVLRGGEKTFTLEYPCYLPTEVRWFLLTATPLSRDLPNGVVITVLDITERKNAESTRMLLTERLCLAAAVAKVGVWEWNLSGDGLTWDPTMFEIYGLPPTVPMTYRKWYAMVHPEDRPGIEAAIQGVICQKLHAAAEFRIVLQDGSVKYLSVVMGVILDAYANVARLIGVNMDVTERKEADDALQKEKERAQVTLNSISEAVISTDNLGDVTFLNLMAEKMTGWSREESEGKPLAEIFRVLDCSSHEPIPQPLQTTAGQKPTIHLPSQSILVRRDGLELPIESCVTPIHNRQGQIAGAVIVFRDVSAAQAMVVKMTHSAQHDYLTGLPNRMLLNDRVSQAIILAKRRMKKLSVLYLDLDGFKHINDSLGHSVGDALLQSVAQRLAQCVRGSDTVSRQGGDEFVVLLAEVEHPEDAAITARRILKEVAVVHSAGVHDLHITTSIGVSVFPDDGGDVETLIKCADTAMYQAKENGRSGYQFFKPAMNVRAVERQTTEECLRRALERQEFAVYYQPKISVKTGLITGAEALLRWIHPLRGAILPPQFIPVAEDCGLIVPIGHWVLREACKQARAWVDAGLSLGRVAVNVSALEFRDDGFPDKVLGILKETGLDPHSLELELTESVLMKRAESAVFALTRLREAGIQIAVDDFGTGYSSLSYLKKFPVDVIKIDQSFVRSLTTHPEDTSIVTAIIRIGQSLNLRVIAEGVETQKEMEFLRAQECDEVQGYLFTRPVDPEQFTSLLEVGTSKASELNSSWSPERKR